MSCLQMVEAVLKAGTWKSGGKTPAATLSAAIHREIKDKGKEARFAKAERGRFRLRPARRSSGRKEAGLRATAGRVPPVWHQTAKRRAGLAAKANATARRGVATIGAG